MSESIILIGGSSHAKVIMDCIHACGGTIAGILDDAIAPGTLVQGIPILGKTVDCETYSGYKFVIAVGDNGVRRRIARQYQLDWATVVHPSAILSPSASIGCGTVVMPGVVINACASIGEHCIINSGVVVEHDNVIEDFVHISPGAALGGTVHVGEETHIGLGACVSNNISICDKSIVGVGAVVVKNITEPGTYVGVPVRRIK